MAKMRIPSLKGKKAWEAGSYLMPSPQAIETTGLSNVARRIPASMSEADLETAIMDALGGHYPNPWPIGRPKAVPIRSTSFNRLKSAK